MLQKLPKFDPGLPHVAARDFVLNGQALRPGDPVTGVDTRRLRQLYESRRIVPGATKSVTSPADSAALEDKKNKKKKKGN